MPNIKHTNIDPETIGKAVNLSYTLANKYLNTENLKKFPDQIRWLLVRDGKWSDITNSIIKAHFAATKSLIEQQYNISKNPHKSHITIQYQINGLDSIIYVNGEKFKL